MSFTSNTITDGHQFHILSHYYVRYRMTHGIDTDDNHAPGRYVGCETDCGDILIYDDENDEAWIRSDTTLSISWQT